MPVAVLPLPLPAPGRLLRRGLGVARRGQCAAPAAAAQRAEVLLFDLDGTLYNSGCGYNLHIRSNAITFLTQRLGIPEEQAGAVRDEAFGLANQTRRGLKMMGYEFDDDEFFAHMRSGADMFLRPDPGVTAAMQALTAGGIPCWVFTNTQEVHAVTCLKLLGLHELFEGRVIGSDFMGAGCCKPEHEAFLKVCEMVGAAPEASVMFEDSFKNARAAKELGMTSIFVKGEEMKEEGATDADLARTCDGVVSACTEGQLMGLGGGVREVLGLGDVKWVRP